MRPWVALAIAAGSVLAWWGTRAAVWWPDAVGVLSRPVVLIPLAPVVLALTLLRRRRLGRLTSRGFVAQAVLWQLVGLARPAWDGSHMTSLLTRPFLAPDVLPVVATIPYTVLGAAWCLVVAWLALVAWTAERAPEARVPAPVGSATGDGE